jgi:hypothetical protein
MGPWPRRVGGPDGRGVKIPLIRPLKDGSECVAGGSRDRGRAAMALPLRRVGLYVG